MDENTDHEAVARDLVARVAALEARVAEHDVQIHPVDDCRKTVAELELRQRHTDEALLRQARQMKPQPADGRVDGLEGRLLHLEALHQRQEARLERLEESDRIARSDAPIMMETFDAMIEVVRSEDEVPTAVYTELMERLRSVMGTMVARISAH
ncbi:MAG: hypothetical protein R3B09_26955 [Nannocystaceae bacterium]